MIQKIYFCICLSFCVVIFACSRDFSVQPTKAPIRQLSSGEKSIVDVGNEFGLKLFQETVEVEPTNNVFISPLSVAMALGMTYNGAAGSTEEAMRKTLGLHSMSLQQINESFQSLLDLLSDLDPEVAFQISNSMWYRREFKVEQPFIDLNQTYFNAEIQPLDFCLPSAPEVINTWIDSKTNGRIKKMIDQIDPFTVMFLIDAIYFKGTWTFEFDQSLTQDDLFAKPDGSQIPCKMMKQANDFSYFENNDIEAIDLPYGNGQFSMMIILPRYDKSLDELIRDLDGDHLRTWLGKLTKQPGTLEFPKFDLEYDILLNDVLASLGMGVAFSDEADFRRINKDGHLSISKVKHKANVKVDEKGTEASAVTVVEIALTSVGEPAGFFMRVDRPFLFTIKENHSQTILFIGKIVEPSL